MRTPLLEQSGIPATPPHLHIHVLDQMQDPETAQLMPWVFAEYDRWDGARWVRECEIGTRLVAEVYGDFVVVKDGCEAKVSAEACEVVAQCRDQRVVAVFESGDVAL